MAKVFYYNICDCFVPYWKKYEEIEKVYITDLECKALYLKYIKKKNIIEWWKVLWVSKSTFANLVNWGIKKIIDAVINKKAIVLWCYKKNDTL